MRVKENLKAEGVPAARVYFPPEDWPELWEEMQGILRSGRLTLGPHTIALEESFTTYLGVRYAVAVNSGTSAIEIPLRIFGVAEAEVIVPTNTFAATAFAVIHAGGRVKFADVDPDTHALSLASVRQALTPQTRAVVTVHIGGAVAPDTPELAELCRERGIIFFEDAAHAHGSRLNGKYAGTFGRAAAFSFYPTKVMTSGEGGLIVTDDEETYRRALVFRDQGKSGFAANLHTEMGYNWRISEVHALLGRFQFRHLPEFIAARRRVAHVYDQELAGVKGIRSLALSPGSFSNYYKYIAILDKGIDRGQFKRTLKERYNISLSGEVYEQPLHLQPVFSYLNYKKGDFPMAEDVCSRQVCLPIFATMREEQARYVADCLKEVLG